MTRWPRNKVLVLGGILVLYVIAGLSLKILANEGVLTKLPPTPQTQQGNDSLEELQGPDVLMNLLAAQDFFRKEFLHPNGHIELYRTLAYNITLPEDTNTNSEAVSYYLFWTAQAGDKEAFDAELAFVEEYMLSPIGYMMWRLTPQGTVVTDGSNIASDADLRSIHALLLAEKKWGDIRYTEFITTLAKGLEETAVTFDGLLAPYGGMSGETTWVAEESWLSYSDFVVFRELANRRGEPWSSMYTKMKQAVLDAQLVNGLYNSQLTKSRQYGNGIDGSGYGINSLWIMVRAAESADKELQASARESLAFYKKQFVQNAEIDTLYDSSGYALSPGDSPWVYALVARAAIALNDDEFSETMITKLLEKQVTNCTLPYYGAFPEGALTKERVGQFTIQEAIITLQAYMQRHGGLDEIMRSTKTTICREQNTTKE